MAEVVPCDASMTGNESAQERTSWALREPSAEDWGDLAEKALDKIGMTR